MATPPEQQSPGDKLAASIKNNESPQSIKDQINNMPEGQRLAALRQAEAKAHEGVPSTSLPHLTIVGETENAMGEKIPKKVIYEHERTDILKDLPIVGGKTATDVVSEDNPNWIESAARAVKDAKKPIDEQNTKAAYNTFFNPEAKKEK